MNEDVMLGPVIVESTSFQVVQEYVYMGQKFQVGKRNFEMGS